jgi:cytochrome c-type biogenesis protein CcmH/NrfF
MARHPFDALSFIFGLFFAAVGLLLVVGDPTRGTIALGWAGPVVAICVGIVVLFAALQRSTSLAGVAGDELLDASEPGTDRSQS